MQRFINEILNLPVHPIQSFHLNNFWTLVVALGWLYLLAVSVLLVCLIAISLFRRFPVLIAFVYRKSTHKELNPSLVFLELAFPWDLSKSAYATEQLHLLLRGQNKYYSFADRLAGRKKLYSLELVGTINEGIRYIMVVPGDEVEQIKRSLLSFLPAMKIREVEDYMTSISTRRIGITELKLSQEFAFPLKDHKALEEHDPFAYFAGHMTKLDEDELVAIQLVVTPFRRSSHMRASQRASRIRRVIASGDMLGPELGRRTFGLPRAVWICLLLPIWVTLAALKIMLAAIALFADTHRNDIPFFDSNRNRRDPSDLYEQEMAGAVKDKLDQGLFEISLRVLVAADSDEAIDKRRDALISAYHMYSTPYQSFISRGPLPLISRNHFDRLFSRFQKRLLTPNLFSYGSIVSGSELSDLYHFPNTEMAKTEGLLKSRSRDLPSPISQKTKDVTFDVILGANTYGGQASPIGVTLQQRQKHTYVIGKTGMGKTTMLKSAIYQDMMNGKGLAVLDPHGDLFHELLAIIPEHRRKDVVVFDPSDREYPVGLNILDPGIEFANEDDKNEWITSAVLSVFKKLADKEQWGPRMEHVLRSATMTSLQLPNPSLYTLQRLLTNTQFQKTAASTIKDPVLKQFWNSEFSLMGKMQISKATSPITHRLGHFITTKMSRHILLQEKSTLRISEIMDGGKILLANLSKGDIGEDQSFFFGTILTSFIWMAAYQRVKIPESERRDFFVYVDEFQNFATPQFAEIVSEGRKFHVSLIISHQNVAQIEDINIYKVVAGNAGTVVAFRGSPEDEDFILPHMRPVVEKGDIVNLAPYHFYMKVTNDESEDAFSGQTIPLDVIGSAEARNKTIVYSRKKYGTPVKIVESHMESLFDSQMVKRHSNDKDEDSKLIKSKKMHDV